MKLAVSLAAILLVCIQNVQLSHLTRPVLVPFPFPYFGFDYGFPQSEESAASLGGAPVGLYSKTSGNAGFGGFPGGFGGIRQKEVSAASLGNSKVAAYGKEHY